MKPAGGPTPELLIEHYELLARIADRYHADADFRCSLGLDGRNVLGGMGLEFPDGMEIRVAANSGDRLYLAMPPDPNTDLGDQTLTAIAGGGVTIGSAGSLGTFSTLTTCWSSLSTAATVGTDSP